MSFSVGEDVRVVSKDDTYAYRAIVSVINECESGETTYDVLSGSETEENGKLSQYPANFLLLSSIHF
jgi:hypothetical protein